MTNFLLFSRRPGADWSPGRRAVFWCWNGGLVLLSALGVGLACLLLAFGPYGLRLGLGLLDTPLLLVLNLLPPVVLMALLYGLTGRAGSSFLVTAGVCVGLSVGNYYKLTFRDDPLLFADLLLLKEAGNMAGNYKLFLDRKLMLVLACVAAGWLFLHVLVRGRPGVRTRFGWISAALLLAVMLSSVYLDDQLYNTRAANYEHIPNRWAATQQYIAHGFLYPFLHSAADAVETPPAGYDRHRAEQHLIAYQDADIPEDQKVNLVAIMLEAYNDFTRFGVPELAQDVYKVWHDLEDEGYSGNLVTNIFAGGTVDTERCFLTGYADLGQFRGLTNSYAWYFREQGYTVEGMHPCYQWFYNRRNINANLGFEDYFFVENYFDPLTGGKVALDDVFFPELLKKYREGTAGDKPYFNFSVTYQGHGPYNDDICWWGDKGDFVVEDGTYTEQQQYILDNYFGSIANTNRHLKELTDYFRADDEPVVLVLFGDHNPWMGDGNSVYAAMGVDFNLDTQEGFFNYYSTRYLIWANDAAKAALGRDFRGEGPDLGPCFLMNKVFELCGWEGPAYLQATNAAAERIPVIHSTGRYLENGVLTDTLSPEGAALAGDYKALEYYQRNTFAYSAINGKD